MILHGFCAPLHGALSPSAAGQRDSALPRVAAHGPGSPGSGSAAAGSGLGKEPGCGRDPAPRGAGGGRGGVGRGGAQAGPRAAAGARSAAGAAVPPGHGHGALAQRRRERGGRGARPGRHGPFQRRGGAGPGEEGPPARRHPLHALPRGRHLPLPQHLRAGAGHVCVGVHCAVWGAHRPPRPAHVLRLLAQHRCCPHPDPHGHRHGGLDHEHLLGHGHGHSCNLTRLQGTGDPTAAVVAGTSMVRETRQEISFGSRGPRTFSLPFVSLLLPFVLSPCVCPVHLPVQRSGDAEQPAQTCIDAPEQWR